MANRIKEKKCRSKKVKMKKIRTRTNHLKISKLWKGRNRNNFW